MKWWFEIDLWKRVIAALVLGTIAGIGLRAGMGADAAAVFATDWVKWLGDLFLRLIRMLVVPLVFFTLVSGMIAMGDPKRLGSLGLRTIGLYFGTTAVAVTLGLIMATLFQPGASLTPEMFEGVDGSAMAEASAKADAAGGFVERFLAIVPTNPFEALAKGDILQVIFFAILFGVGIMLAGDMGKPVAAFFDGAAEVMMKVTEFVMETAPFGVFALMTWVLATQGLGILQSLGVLAIALYLACILHIIITYGGILKFVLRLPLMPFFRGVTDAQAVAYSTSSSSATLPVTIACAEENLGVDKSIAGSVLPLGATINMDGTAIYIGMVALFGAQALGVDVTLGQYVLVALMATLVSIGAAGIPSAGLLLSGMALQQVGIPQETAYLVIGFILPFDRLLDMMRTLTNVTGDATVATAVAKWEDEFDYDIYIARDPV